MMATRMRTAQFEAAFAAGAPVPFDIMLKCGGPLFILARQHHLWRRRSIHCLSRRTSCDATFAFFRQSRRRLAHGPLAAMKAFSRSYTVAPSADLLTRQANSHYRRGQRHRACVGAAICGDGRPDCRFRSRFDCVGVGMAGRHCEHCVDCRRER